MFVAVAVENTTFSFDKLFTYEVPSELTLKAVAGARVSVPFGGGNKTRIAMVFSASEKSDSVRVKSILSVLDEEPILTTEMLELAHWMKSRYFCTYYDIIRTMLPTGIGYNIEYVFRFINMPNEQHKLTSEQMKALDLLSTAKKDLKLKDIGVSEDVLRSLVKAELISRIDITKRKTGDSAVKMIMPAADFNGTLTPKQEGVLAVLEENGAMSIKELTYFTGVSQGVIKALIDKAAAVVYEQEAYRRPQSLKALPEETTGAMELSIEQDKVLDSLIEEYEAEKGKTSLLYGVTGSGKTSVFFKLIDYVVGKGKEVILMVPEIALTPQTIDLFNAKFGEDIAVIHSGLSVGERLDEWKRVKRGLCKIVIGTRSAIFAPFQNLGLIVIDEEQEHTYKSENSPRYNAKDVAKFRTMYAKAFCLLSSATPSLESYYMAEKGTYGFNKLDARYGSATLPEVRVVDMNQESVFGNTTDISFALKRGLNDNLRQGLQSIVLLNRRGYHTFSKCKDCHSVVTCPNCSISLTLHSANNRLMCHYCGHSVPVSSICPSCGGDAVSFSGYGTQRAEEAIKEAVPEARILRIDADSTTAKYSLEKKLDAFSSGEYDILVGTQMVAKGLNFENVTLVGVLSADQSLFSDDFRSNEKTFDLLTQVVGRSGRGKYPGQAIIQTNVPENQYLRLAANQDYLTFYEMEITYRMAMLYPPIVDILLIGFVGETESTVSLCSNVFLKKLTQKVEQLNKKLPLRILRPSAAAVAKIGGKFRYKLIIKCKNTIEFRKIIESLLIDFTKDKDFSSVTVFADPNPYTVI